MLTRPRSQTKPLKEAGRSSGFSLKCLHCNLLSRCHKMAQAQWAPQPAGVVFHQPHPRVGSRQPAGPGCSSVSRCCFYSGHRSKWLSVWVGVKKKEPVVSEGMFLPSTWWSGHFQSAKVCQEFTRCRHRGLPLEEQDSQSGFKHVSFHSFKTLQMKSEHVTRITLLNHFVIVLSGSGRLSH